MQLSSNTFMNDPLGILGLFDLSLDELFSFAAHPILFELSLPSRIPILSWEWENGENDGRRYKNYLEVLHPWKNLQERITNKE